MFRFKDINMDHALAYKKPANDNFLYGTDDRIMVVLHDMQARLK